MPQPIDSNRRDKGSGSYRQRKDGRWEGRYKGKFCYAKTEAGIKKALKSMVQEINGNGYEKNLNSFPVTVDEIKAVVISDAPLSQEKQVEQMIVGQDEPPTEVSGGDADEVKAVVVSDTPPSQNIPAEQGSDQAGQLSPSTEMTVGDWLDMWFSEYKALTIRPSTHASYYNSINIHLKPRLGQIALGSLEPLEIQSAFNSMSKSGLAPATIIKCRNVLNGAYDQAVKTRLLRYNPVQATKPPRGSPPEIDILTVEQQQKFMQTARGNRLESFFLTALGTGMRRGELIALTWDCVDFEKKTIMVKASAGRVQTPETGGTTWVVDTTKTNAGRRNIPLVDSLIPVLQDHQEQQNMERKFAGSVWAGNNLVFSTGIGTYIEPRNISRELNKILDRADLPPISIHALRHTFASRLLESGVHIKVVQEILGHADAALTLNTYSHIVGTTAHDQMNKLNAIFTGTAPTEEKPVFRRNLRLSTTNAKKKTRRER